MKSSNITIGTIGIIGFGHMGKAIYRALTKKSFGHIFRSDGDNNIDVTKKADTIILCVKPMVVSKVLREIAPFTRKNQLIISIAAGIALKTIEKNLKKSYANQNMPSLVRAIPNLPAQIGFGMTVWKSARRLHPRQKNLLKHILNAIGEEIEVKKENLLDAATAVSGSGPAYVFSFLDALSKSANKFGFSQKEARLLALQTVKGSVNFAKESQIDFKTLVAQVKTKGGTTEAAFKKVLEKKKWGELLQDAIKAAYKRSRELGR